MKSVLLVAHSNPRSANIFGGTELLLKQILDNARVNDISLFFMYPEHYIEHDTWVIELDKREVARFSLKNMDGTQKVLRFSQLIADFLLKQNVVCLHVFHQLSTPLVLIPLAKLLGINTIYTIHDFIHICDSFNLINSNREYCNIFSSESHDCVGCSTARGVSPDSLLRRRIAYKRILDDSDLISVGTNFSGKATSDFYQIDPSKFRVIPPSIGSSEPRFHKTLPQSVLFLGNFTLPKGAKLIPRLVSDSRLKSYKFTQAGRVDVEFQSAVSFLSENFDFKSLGKYNLGEVPETSASIAFFGSIWPETFCIAATEAIDRGLKIVVPDIGAFRDRFIDKENCFFYEPNVLDSAISAILKANATPMRVTNELEKIPVFVQQIFNLYESLETAELSEHTNIDYLTLEMPLVIDWIFNEPSVASRKLNLSKFTRAKNYYNSYGLIQTLKRLIQEILSK